jgi:pyridoxine 5-phosphate synthase
VRALQAAGIPVSLFIAPDSAQVRVASQLQVPRIELHTGAYCDALLSHLAGPNRSLAPATAAEQADTELERLAHSTEEAIGLGLHVAAGHGLDYTNVRAVAAIPGVEELNIGHAIVARAVLVGLDAAVRDMLAILREVG